MSGAQLPASALYFYYPRNSTKPVVPTLAERFGFPRALCFVHGRSRPRAQRALSPTRFAGNEHLLGPLPICHRKVGQERWNRPGMATAKTVVRHETFGSVGITPIKFTIQSKVALGHCQVGSDLALRFWMHSNTPNNLTSYSPQVFAFSVRRPQQDSSPQAQPGRLRSRQRHQYPSIAGPCSGRIIPPPGRFAN